MFININIGFCLILTAFGKNPKKLIFEDSTNFDECLKSAIFDNFDENGATFEVVKINNASIGILDFQNHLISAINSNFKRPLKITDFGEIGLENSTKKIDYQTGHLLLLVDDCQKFKTNIPFVLSQFSPNTKIIVHVQIFCPKKTLEEILQILWLNKFYKTTIVVNTKNSTTNGYYLDIYSSTNKCLQNPKMKPLFECFKGKIRYTMGEMPKKFNCNIDVIAPYYPPNVIDENSGFEIKLLREIGVKLGIRFNITIDRVGEHWGFPYPNGTWYGRLGLIQNEFFVSVGNAPLNDIMFRDFHFSICYCQDMLVWVVPRAKLVPHWRRIFKIFPLNIWIGCFCTFVISTWGFYFTSKNTINEKPNYMLIGDDFLGTIRIIIGQPIKTQPISVQVRILFTSIALFSIIICTTFNASLIKILSSQMREHQISTTEEILKLDLPFGGVNIQRHFFMNSKIGEKYQIRRGSNTAKDWLRRVSKDNYCAITGKFYAFYLLSQNDPVVLDENGDVSVFITKNPLVTDRPHMIVPKGYPLLDLFDGVIYRLINGGFLIKWLEHNRAQVERAAQLKLQQKDQLVSLTMDHLQGIFMCFILGLSFSTIVLLLEIVICNKSKQH